ncbi:MAG: hypothetical protein ACE5WD_11815 [Candidatus Aminicenantia bacterium]
MPGEDAGGPSPPGSSSQDEELKDIQILPDLLPKDEEPTVPSDSGTGG